MKHLTSIIAALWLATPAAALTAFEGAPDLAGWVTEDFSGLPSGEGNVTASVGFFAAGPGCGGGRSVVETGCAVAIRPSASHGRTSGALDSNDNEAVLWDLAGPYRRLFVELMDAGDQGGTLSIWVGDAMVFSLAPGRDNGNIFGLTIDTGPTVAPVTFHMDDPSGFDGWAITTAAYQPAAVPVPATIWLLGSSVAGMLYRRKRGH